jgi:hypothetical protein
MWVVRLHLSSPHVYAYRRTVTRSLASTPVGVLSQRPCKAAVTHRCTGCRSHMTDVRQSFTCDVWLADG